jgi:hypothetical protein
MASVKQRVECLQCNKTYASRDSLQKHNRFGRCKATDSTSDTEPEVILLTEDPHPSEIDEYRQQSEAVPIIDLPLVSTDKAPNPHLRIPNELLHNPDDIHLQVNANLLDLLREQLGSKMALTRLRDYALAKLFGDCYLIEKFYFPIGKRPAIMLANTKKTHWIYYDENNQAQTETDPLVLAKMLAQTLQRSYFTGSECLTDPATDKPYEVAPNDPDLIQIEPYYLGLWMEHAHQLDDEAYQMTLFNSIRIPLKDDVLV